MFDQVVSVTTFYSDIFWLDRNLIWSSLIKFDALWTDLNQTNENKTVSFILFVNVTTFYVTFFDCWEIQFDQVWSILDKSEKKIKNKTAIFKLFENVTTEVPILQVELLFRMKLWQVAHFFHSFLGGCNSKATVNSPKCEWKKWATAQSCIGKRGTTCKIGTLKASKSAVTKRDVQKICWFVHPC